MPIPEVTVKNLQAGQNLPSGLTVGAYDIDEVRDVAIIQHQLGVKTVEPDKQLSTLVEAYLNIEKTRIRPGTFVEKRQYLKELQEQSFVPKDASLVSEDTVEKYYLFVMGLPHEATSKKKRMNVFYSFLDYLDEKRVIELPRNSRSKKFRIKVTPKEITTYETPVVSAFIKGLPERFRLYALLALNCGMQSGDMSFLEHGQVKNGILTRKRIKTADHKNVPTVSYKLWDETLALLNKHKSKHPKYWLTSLRGTPLAKREYVDGEPVKFDGIARQYQKRKYPIPLAAFRSIGATMLESNVNYGRHVGHYLGHAPESVADIHYAAKGKELFGEVITWLGQQFGF